MRTRRLLALALITFALVACKGEKRKGNSDLSLPLAPGVVQVYESPYDAPKLRKWEYSLNGDTFKNGRFHIDIEQT